jgi:hypothetical protein
MPGEEQLIAGIGQGVSSIVKGIVGAGQIKKGRKLLNSLQYPNEEVPSEIVSAASTGLPSEQYNQAMKNIQRQQLVALRGANDRRGGLGLVSNLQQNSNDATLNLDAKNAEARQANQFRLAGWKDKVWQNNIRDKYAMDRSYAMGLIGSGNQNVFGGVDQAIGGSGLIANSMFGNSRSNQYGQALNATI